MLNLIPRPQNITITGNKVLLSAFSQAKVSGLDSEHLSALGKFNPALQICSDTDGFYFALYTHTCPAHLPVGDGFDAYSLNISENGIRADAKTKEGLFYALQTFLQLPEDCDCAEISDAAQIRYRVIHWDLKGYLPHLHTLQEEMRRLAAYKVNAILLELEDKYDYRCAPGIGVEGAYTFEEMREFSQFAKRMHITIIPKLQSIAHVDYILKHERYRHLRENGHVFQFCQTNPEVFSLWAAMCDELLECFAEHGPYFHIGADEPGNLGECPQCAKLGKAASYLHAVNACVNYLVSKDRIPIMWDDIIRNHYGLFSPEEANHLRATLGKQAIIMYWSYGYGGKNNTFPYTKEYMDAGLTVWGASGYSGCDNWSGSIPPLDLRALNIDAWTKEAITHKLEGVCATGWTRIGSADCPADPQEGSWFTILYSAASMWNIDVYDYDTFVDILALQLYNMPLDPALQAAVHRISQNSYPYQAFADTADEEPEELKLLKILAAAETLGSKQNTLLTKFQYYDRKLGNTLEDYRHEQLCAFATGLLEEINGIRNGLQDYLSRYYKAVTVAEFIDTRVNAAEKLAKQLLTLLEDTKTY